VDDDLHTRLTLLERTAVSTDQLVEREDKLIGRMEDMLKRYISQASDDQKHQFKLFGHEMADQLRTWEKKIHSDRDEIDKEREADRRPAPTPQSFSPIKAWVLANWAWAAGIAMLVVILRPDLAGAAVKAIF
jgi:hypothetical protein